MERQRIVTTSWDDGDYADMRLAEMLRSRGVAGTFYVPTRPYGGRLSLSTDNLRSLSSEGFEIGAHGVTHQLLWGLSAKELASEIAPCKPTLEGIVGKEVRMFCYPCGRYDANVVRSLKNAGYWGARTVRMLVTGFEFDPFEMPTTVQIIPQPRASYFKNVARSRRLDSLRVCLANLPLLDNWLELGKRLFDSVLENGGVWHMYGHSHEIDKLGLWGELEEILDYVSKREGVQYVPNSELIRLRSAGGSRNGNGHS